MKTVISTTSGSATVTVEKDDMDSLSDFADMFTKALTAVMGYDVEVYIDTLSGPVYNRDGAVDK